MTMGGPGTVFEGVAYGYAGGDPSIKFSLDGTETLGDPKRLVNSDAQEDMPNHAPRLVRCRSYDLPFVLLVTEGFQRTTNVRRFQIPGGSSTTKTAGAVEVVCYGGIKTAAYAIQSRAVVDAELEILPFVGHSPALGSLSDQVVLDPDGTDPGDWTVIGALSSGWQPGGRPRLDLVTDGPIEFGFWSSASSSTLIASFVVDGMLPGGIIHPAPYQLQARHPGGAGAASRSCIATWSRGVG